MKNIYLLVILIISSIFGFVSPVSSMELCVGAAGYQKAGYCKLEFEAYVTTGSCKARNGQWDNRYRVTLRLKVNGTSGGEEERTARQYVNRNHRIVPFCPNLICANAFAEPLVGGLPAFRTSTRCNRRSYD